MNISYTEIITVVLFTIFYILTHHLLGFEETVILGITIITAISFNLLFKREESK